MAKKTVRYQVLKRVFVNGSLYDPATVKNGGPLFVVADEGLEGSALKLAPEKPARKPKDDGGPPPPASDPGPGKNESGEDAGGPFA